MMTDFAEQLQNALGTNYQLDRELTGGGMSRVFVAIDRVLGRKVVVKVLPPELAAGVNRDRFRREIQVAAQLQHPHIVPLLSAGEQGDLLWYTMPFIDGESLRAALERKKPFSAREVMRILHDVVDALAFAHARGVIHRDIKPANILTQGAHALVTDFGVAKALSAALPIGGVTSAGIAIGTPAYMAPEQLAGDAAADHRIDIYAVGLLAYELVTGVSPFTGPSPRETLAAQLTRDPKPLHEVSAERAAHAVRRSSCAAWPRIPHARPQTRRRDPAGARLDDDAARRHAAERRRRSAEAAPPLDGDLPRVAILFAVLAGVGYAVSRERRSLQRRVPRHRQAAAPRWRQPRSGRLDAVVARAGRRAAASHRRSTAAQAGHHARGFGPHRRGGRESAFAAAKTRDSVAKAQARRRDAAQDDGLDHRGELRRAPPASSTGPRRLVIAEPADRCVSGPRRRSSAAPSPTACVACCARVRSSTCSSIRIRCARCHRRGRATSARLHEER